MWRRFIRSKAFILLIFMAIFSFGILGQVDTRMHIGGSDWDLDSLVYINIDDFLVEEDAFFLAEDETAVDVSPELAEDEGEEIEQKEEERVTKEEPAEEKTALIEQTPPAAAPPKVEEKREKENKPLIFTHSVHGGETLWDIAKAYGVTVETILSANDLGDPNRIRIGQELRIPSVKGILHRVSTGESLWEIADRYKISIDEIAEVNSIQDPGRIKPNDEIVIPGATRLMPRDVLVVNGQLQRAFDWPVRGRISSPFGPRWGKMHNGLDIAVATGTSVRAAADGRVTFAGWNGGYGILVIVDHGNGVETRYAHNSRLNVKVGQRVERGQVICFSGNTGVSTGPHLHFEIRYRNKPLNPQTYLR